VGKEIISKRTRFSCRIELRYRCGRACHLTVWTWGESTQWGWGVPMPSENVALQKGSICMGTVQNTDGGLSDQSNQTGGDTDGIEMPCQERTHALTGNRRPRKMFLLQTYPPCKGDLVIVSESAQWASGHLDRQSHPHSIALNQGSAGRRCGRLSNIDSAPI